MLESWDEAKGRLFIAAYNKDRHAEYLKDKVYTCVEDLAIVPRLLVGRRSDGIIRVARKTAANLNTYHLDLRI